MAKEKCMVRAKFIPSFRVSMSRCLPTEEEACAFEKEKYEAFDGAVGRGAFREAYDFRGGKCIVKVALDKVGVNDNERETLFSQSPPEPIRDLIVPVVAHSPSFKWIVMPKAEVARFMSWQESGKVDREIKKKLDNVGYFFIDLHEGNIGRLEGKPVILDYGIEIKCKRK